MTLDFFLKSSLCLGLLWLVYKLVLESEKTHVFNRFFLLFGLFLSFLIPFLNFEIEADIIPNTVQQLDLVRVEQHYIQQKERIATPQETTNQPYKLLIIWLVGSFLMVLRFIKNLIDIFKTSASKSNVKEGKLNIVFIDENQTPYSFLNYIFISKSDFKQAERRLFLHEKCHARQLHSIDIILIELLQVVFWLNPILILYKEAIKLNHEFLADDAVNFQFKNIVSYQLLLLSKTHNLSNQFASNSTFQLTKQRLKMMTKHTSVTLAAVKITATLVCTFLIGCGLSSSIIAQSKVATKKEGITVEIDLATKKEQSSTQKYHLPTEEEWKWAEKILKNPYNLDVDLEKGEYYVLYGPTNLKDKKKDNPLKYSELTEEQLAIATPMLPSKALKITNAMMLDWQNVTKYGVWINQKKVPNGELKRYKAEDIHDFFVSKLYGKALKNVNYLYQIDINTNDYFKNIVLKQFAEKPIFSVNMAATKSK